MISLDFATFTAFLLERFIASQILRLQSERIPGVNASV